MARKFSPPWKTCWMHCAWCHALQADLFLEPAAQNHITETNESDREHLFSFLSPTETHVDDLIRESSLPAESGHGAAAGTGNRGPRHPRQGRRVALA
jgi:hypothetical protein